MKKTYLSLPLLVAILLCGCDRQTKLNTAKIEMLSQKMVELQQTQAKQMAVFQTQLTQLAPMMDKMNSIYFAKSHDDALFFHTNTLYLLLTVDKKIEAQLQVADTERQADSVLAYAYHTNELDLLHFYNAQMQDAMLAQEGRLRDALAGQEKSMEDNINAATRQTGTNVGDELANQIKLSAPDAAEIARLKQMAADLAQMKRDLDAIKAQLGQLASPPTVRP
jgi:hypothetical protein